MVATVVTVFAAPPNVKSDREELRLVGDVKSVLISENGIPTLRYDFSPTQNGNLWIGYTYKDDGKIDYTIKRGPEVTNPETNEFKKVFLWQRGVKTEIKREDYYDEAGNVVGYSYFNLNSNNEFVKQSYKYDASGNKDERGTGISDAKKNKVEKFAYDNMGNIIEKAEYINDIKAREFKYSYEFDLEGNWTKRTIQSKDIAAGQTNFRQSSITTRDFSYYSLKNPPPPVVDPVKLSNNFGYADTVHVLGADVTLPTDYKTQLSWKLTGNVPTIKAGDFLTAGDVANGSFKFGRYVESAMKNADGSITVNTSRIDPTKALPKRKPGDPNAPVTDPNAPIVPDPIIPVVVPSIRLKENCVAILPTNDKVKIAGMDTKDKFFTKITFSAIDTQPAVGSYLYLAINPPVVNEEKYLKVEATEQKYGVTVITASNATPFDIIRPAKPGRQGLVQYKPNVMFTKVNIDYKMTELTDSTVAFLDPSPSWQVGDIVVLDQNMPVVTQPTNPNGMQPQPQPTPVMQPQTGVPGIGGTGSNERKILRISHPVTGITVFDTTQAQPAELYNEIPGYKYPVLQPKVIPGLPNGAGPNMNPNDAPLILTADMPYKFMRVVTINNIPMAIFENPAPTVQPGKKIIIPQTPNSPEIVMTVNGMPTPYGNNTGIPVIVDNQNQPNNPNGTPQTQQPPVQPAKPTIKAGVKVLPSTVRVSYYNEANKSMILKGDVPDLRKGDLVVFEGPVLEAASKKTLQGIQVRITVIPPVGGVLRYSFEKVSKDEVYDQPQVQANNNDPMDDGNMGAGPGPSVGRPKTVGPGVALPPVVTPMLGF